jgi:hypothetical protein
MRALLECSAEKKILGLGGLALLLVGSLWALSAAPDRETPAAAQELLSLSASSAVVLQRTASGIYNETVAQTTEGHKASRGALDVLQKLAAQAKAVVLEERDNQRAMFKEYAAAHPESRGQLADYVKKTLGPIPKYDPNEIVQFGNNYEIELYKKFYARGAYIYVPSPNRGAVNEYVKGIPDKILDRVQELTGAATHVAAVVSWNLKRVVEACNSCHSPSRMRKGELGRFDESELESLIKKEPQPQWWGNREQQQLVDWMRDVSQQGK